MADAFVPQVLAQMGRVGLHPTFIELAAYWDFLRVSYLGGEAWTAQGTTWRYAVPIERETESSGYKMATSARVERAHLWRHPREENYAYEARFRSATYHNFVEPAIKESARALLRGVVPAKLPASLAHLEKDMDGRGRSLDAFRSCLVEWADCYGHMHVIGDRPV